MISESGSVAYGNSQRPFSFGTAIDRLVAAAAAFDTYPNQPKHLTCEERSKLAAILQRLKTVYATSGADHTGQECACPHSDSPLAA